MVKAQADPIVLSEQEAKELYRNLVNDYLDPNIYPALRALIGRLAQRYGPRA